MSMGMSHYLGIAQAAGDRAIKDRERREAELKKREEEAWRAQTADKLDAYYQSQQGVGLGAPVQAPSARGAQGTAPPVGLGPPPTSAGAANPNDHAAIVARVAQEEGVDPDVFDSLWAQESGRSVNIGLRGETLPKGKYAGHYARGPFQIMSFHGDIPQDFEGQARWAARHLKERGLRGYYGTGSPVVAGHPTTDQYEQQVLARAGRSAGGGAAPGGQSSQGRPLGQAPAPSVDTTQAARLYQEIVVDAFRNGQLEQAAPVLAQLASKGFAAHMQSFQGDPSTPDGAVEFMWHMGAGAGAFGRDPWEIANQAAGRGAAFNQVRQSDESAARANRQEDRMQESHRAEMEDSQLVRDLAQHKSSAEKTKLMLQFLNAGMTDKAQEIAKSLGYSIENPEPTEIEVPNVGPARTVKFDLKSPNGEVMPTDALTMAGHLGLAGADKGADKKTDKLHSVEQRDEWGEVKSKGWGVPRKDAAGNPYLQEVPVRPAVAGLGGSPAAPQSRSEERNPAPESTIDKPLKAALVNGEEVIMVGSKSFAPVFGKPYSLPNGETRYYAGPGKWSLREPSKEQ